MKVYSLGITNYRNWNWCRQTQKKEEMRVSAELGYFVCEDALCKYLTLISQMVSMQLGSSQTSTKAASEGVKPVCSRVPGSYFEKQTVAGFGQPPIVYRPRSRAISGRLCKNPASEQRSARHVSLISHWVCFSHSIFLP